MSFKRVLIFITLMIIEWNLLSAQVTSICEYPKAFIMSKNIKSIIVWQTANNDTTKRKSLDIIYYYDRHGNMVDYHGGGEANPYSHIRYVYDSSDHLIWSYFTDEDGFISNVEGFIFRGDLLIEDRTYYTEYKKFHKDTIGFIYRAPSYGEKYSYNANGNLIRESLINTNSKNALELGREYPDSLQKLPELKCSPDDVKYDWSIESTFDRNGNMIRHMTTPNSSYIYINDSFSYDEHKNIIYKITFNSGDVSKYDGRKKVDGQHRETHYKNIYNRKNQLTEIRTYFPGCTICCLRDTFIYGSNGKPLKRIVFKTYPDSVLCFASYGGGEVFDLHAFKPSEKKNCIIVSDTLFYKEYNSFGELIDDREYFGVDQKKLEGTLYHREYKVTNKEGVMLHKGTFYDDSGEGSFELHSDYLINKDGMIEESRKEEETLYITYTFY